MKKIIFSILTFSFLVFNVFAEEEEIEMDSTEVAAIRDSIIQSMQDIDQSLNYIEGEVELENGNANITVPAGFKFLAKEEAMYVVSDLWGNPADEDVIGLLLPKESSVMDYDSYAFIISYDDMGYVDDDDASDIDYEEMLETMQEESIETNASRVEVGYEPIEFVGWATPPHYDSDKKILHWAKEIRFGEAEENTLNYNLRILGRKGIFMLNAVALMSSLPEVEADIDAVINSVEFHEGHGYFDFDPDIDEVAAWTIGGLVAGKLLAKMGFLAVLFKFGKFGLIALFGGGSAWKFVKKRMGKKELPQSIKEEEKEDVASEASAKGDTTAEDKKGRQGGISR